MVTSSVVSLSQLEGARRVDAEYYQPDSLELVNGLRRRAAVPLERFCYFIKKGIFDLSPTYYQEHGVPFVRTTEIKSGIADLTSAVFISKDTHCKHAGTELGSGDIVFTKIGANIGDSAILPKSHETYNFSQNVAGAKVRRMMISPYYLAGYLASRYGRVQLKRAQMPSGQGKLELIDIKKILIFVADSKFQKYIEELYLRAEDKTQKSIELYSQAENLLLEELGLKDFKPKYELSYSANLSKAFKAHRVDAEYFQPAYDEIVNHLSKNFVTEKLKNIVSLLKHGKQPYYVEGGEVPILIQKHLGSLHVNLDALNDQDTPRTDREFTEKYPEYKVQSGDVLFYSVGAYLGRTNVLLTQIDAVPASFITLIRTKKNICSPMFLAVFLNSKVGQLQSNQRKSASAQQYIYPKDIGGFIIPILPDKTQQEIASLVQQSYEAREKAKQHLEEAKNKVENLIEGRV